jgi:ABC-type multidrug transport system fused ATPase/permease subunit
MPLIGVDDMETPDWARGYEKVVQASLREVAVAVPRTMAQIVRWAWRAAPRLTLLTGALQLLTGCVQAFGLLATANVFTRLLAEGPTPERVLAALPALAVVVAAYAGRGLLDAAEGAVQAALAPRVQRGTALGYLVLGLLLYTGGMPLPLAGTAVLAMRAAASAIVNSMFQVSQLYESGFTLELHRTLIADSRERSRPTGRATPTGPAEIVLAGVSFRYPGHDERALADVSLTLRRGEVIALVGENGSGKSTLAKLLTGLYLPDEGVVTWDGVDTASIGAPALHERIAVVLQDPLHWPMTAANNVRIGRLDRPDPGDVAFTDAAARSGADAVLAALPTAPRPCCRASSRRAGTSPAGSGSGSRWPAGSTGTHRW